MVKAALAVCVAARRSAEGARRSAEGARRSAEGPFEASLKRHTVQTALKTV